MQSRPGTNTSSQGFVSSPHGGAAAGGFGSSPHSGAGGGTMFVVSTPVGRLQSVPAAEPGGYSDRQSYVPRTQSLYQMTKPPEYSIDPVQIRNHERSSYVPSHPPDQYGRWSPHQLSPHQPEYGGTQTPERPRLDFRVPSSGSGYSDWSATPVSGQSTPGSHRMPMFEMSTPTNTPTEYRQLPTPADYYSSTANSYHASTPGDYRPPSSHSQDRRVYPSDLASSLLQNPGLGHHPVSSPDLNYGGGRQPVYSMGYGAVSSHYTPVSRPNEPLCLKRQSM